MTGYLSQTPPPQPLSLRNQGTSSPGAHGVRTMPTGSRSDNRTARCPQRLTQSRGQSCPSNPGRQEPVPGVAWGRVSRAELQRGTVSARGWGGPSAQQPGAGHGGICLFPVPRGFALLHEHRQLWVTSDSHAADPTLTSQASSSWACCHGTSLRSRLP